MFVHLKGSWIMKLSRGIVEDGIIVGNVYNKYQTRNPLVKLIMNKYRESLNGLIEQIKPNDIHEVGCGEGYWVIMCNKKGISARGSDVSEKAIIMAKENAKAQAVPHTIFTQKNIYNLAYPLDSAELVLCCEVLEHLENPGDALCALSRIANPYLILSVPREPIWSLLNILRGKYLIDFGNTPGHIQRWSKTDFINLALQHFEVLTVKSPLPWTMLLCQKRIG